MFVLCVIFSSYIQLLFLYTNNFLSVLSVNSLFLVKKDIAPFCLCIRLMPRAACISCLSPTRAWACVRYYLCYFWNLCTYSACTLFYRTL